MREAAVVLRTLVLNSELLGRREADLDSDIELDLAEFALNCDGIFFIDRHNLVRLEVVVRAGGDTEDIVVCHLA